MNLLVIENKIQNTLLNLKSFWWLFLQMCNIQIITYFMENYCWIIENVTIIGRNYSSKLFAFIYTLLNSILKHGCILFLHRNIKRIKIEKIIGEVSLNVHVASFKFGTKNTKRFFLISNILNRSFPFGNLYMSACNHSCLWSTIQWVG